MKQKYFEPLRWLFKVMWQASRTFFAWNIVDSVIRGVSPIAYVYVAAKLTSTVSAAALSNGDPNQVYKWLGAILALEIFRIVEGELNSLISRRSEQRIQQVTEEHFLYKMYDLSQEQYDDQAFNTKVERAKDGLSQLWRIQNNLSWLASSTISFFGSIAAIIVVSKLLGLIICVSIIPAMIVNFKLNKNRELVYKETEPIERVASRTQWMLADRAMMPEIRLMNAFKKLINIWRTETKKAQDLEYKSLRKLNFASAAADAIQPSVSFGSSIYFFHLLLAGNVSLDRFIFLRGMLEQASNGTWQLTSGFSTVQSIVINLRSFSEIYNTKPSIPNGHIKITRPLTIEFKDVSFHYPTSKAAALSNVSFLIVPGSKLALVGENGAGKTTLIKLLLRQYLPTTGTITINGHDIKDIEQQSYYAAISNLSQEFMIFNHLTIRDNLTIGLDEIPTDSEIYETADLVGATEFLKKLPKKLSSRLDTSFKDGTNLSGGQNQRLGVARALLRKGDIMILDEPTSAIDAKAEYSIFNNIYKAHANRTTLIVSHRFSTVRKADKIIVMENGEITEYGSHEELLAYGKLYKEMFEAQAEGYK